MTTKETVTDIITSRVSTDSVPADAVKITAAVEEAEYAIRTYCKRWIEISPGSYEELPVQIAYIWAEIAYGLYAKNTELYTLATIDPSESTAPVKAIQEGDSKVEFDNAAKISFAGTTATGLVNMYANQLNQFRRLYASIR